MTEERNFQQKQNELAEKSGLAIVLVNEKEIVSEARNNSVCRLFLSSPNFASACAEFCGRAFERANSLNRGIKYRCHAGFGCLAVPFEENKTVAIIGRAILSGNDYRALTERFRNGDLKNYPAESILEDVPWADLDDLEKTTDKFLRLKPLAKSVLPKREIAETAKDANAATVVKERVRTETSKNATDEILQEVSNEYLERLKKLSEAVRETKPPTEIKAKTGLPLETEAKIVPSAETPKINDLSPQKQTSEKEIGKNTSPLVENLPKETAPRPTGSLADMIKMWREKQEAELKSPILTELPTVIIKKPSGETTELEGGKTKNRESIRTEIIEKVIHPVSQAKERNEAEKALPVAENKVEKKIETATKTTPVLPILEATGEINNLIGAVFQQDFSEACAEAMRFLRQRHQISALAWLERRDKKLETISTIGVFKTPQMRIGLEVTDSRLLKVVVQETSLRLQARLSKSPDAETQFIELFPLAVGNEVKGALVIGEKLPNDKVRRQISEFCRQIAVPFEVLRLREEVKNRAEEAEKLQNEAREFELAAITDDLTGLLNKRYIKERLEEELRRSARHEYPMCFMMLDVDNFKKFNDDFGHQTGDAVLRETAKSIKSALRGADIAARYGGEEFCVLLPQTTIREAATVAERIRRKVENTKFPQRTITVSIGVAGFSEANSTSESLINAADKALYFAKKNGRNNVQIAK